MRQVALTLMVLGMLLASCGQDPVAGPSDGEADGDTAPGDAKGEEIREGTLDGDASLEGGCAWLDTRDGRLEVLYPEGYEVVFEPLRLLGPDGEAIAEEGDTVRVRGRVAADRMSICQVGTIFQASEVVSE